MDWKDIASAVGKAAPILGTLVAGPAGTAIGGLIASALGVENTPDAVNQALANDPDALVKVKQIESDERVHLKQMLFTHADNVLAANTAAIQSDVDDRKSAREREVTAKDSTTPQVLAGIVVASSVALGVFIVAGWATKEPSLAGQLGIVIGYVFSESKQVLAYYFGSSAGSAAKTELLAKATPAIEPNAISG